MNVPNVLNLAMESPVLSPQVPIEKRDESLTLSFQDDSPLFHSLALPKAQSRYMMLPTLCELRRWNQLLSKQIHRQATSMRGTDRCQR